MDIELLDFFKDLTNDDLEAKILELLSMDKEDSEIFDVLMKALEDLV